MIGCETLAFVNLGFRFPLAKNTSFRQRHLNKSNNNHHHKNKNNNQNDDNDTNNDNLEQIYNNRKD